MARAESKQPETAPANERELLEMQEIARTLLRQNQELARMLERVLPAAKPKFIPTPFQVEILAALDGRGLRTDALAHATGTSKGGLYRDPGGLPELAEQGLVANHPRVGHYRPDAPPPELSS